ncbi:MAG: Rrf2 family transcriptional regulator [Planctomycetes bacterium]|nr:Rrf2 family transcriptional regulator [Planctomycetota bacterium]
MIQAAGENERDGVQNQAMLLNQTAVYGLRAMATLTSLAPGESINVIALSERTGVPQQYLSKVMRKLVVARLVRSQRGHGGGFALMKAPRQIRLIDVLRAIDLDLDGGCAFGFAACDPTNPCTLHPIWSKMQECIQEWAGDSTLADLGPGPTTPRTRKAP